jgi:uncharacterized protein YhaN
MRFDSLNIPAYGPFTGYSLSFTPSAQDLHVIYGKNEAGKSSLLRAIHHLLYGIPNSTSDDFIHEYKKLRIGATVNNGDERLTFLRRKGNSGTLLDEHQNTIDEGKLKAFCGSVNAEFFTHMFGLSTDNLRAGATNLLSEKGELGALLFSASIGGSPIDAAITKLQIEADQLFAGSGRKANSIVAAYTSVTKHEKDSRSHSLSITEWKKLKRRLETAEKDFASKEKTLTDKRTRKTRVESLISAIPLIQQRKAAATQLAEITIPDLPSDFPERVRASQSSLATAESLISDTRTILKNKKEQLSEIAPFQSVLDDGPVLDWLHQAIAQHLDDIHNIDSAKRSLDKLHQEQLDQLERLNLPDVDTLTSLPETGNVKLASIKKLADSFAAAERAYDQARRDSKNTTRALKNETDKLSNLKDTDLSDELRDLEARVAEQNQNHKLAAEWIKTRDKTTAEIQKLTNQLGLCDLEPEAIPKLAVPAAAVLLDFESIKTQLAEDHRRAQAELDELTTNAVELESEIQAATNENSVVTLSNLHDSRQERDEQWTSLAAKILSKSEIAAEESTTFKMKMLDSDEVADSLREHAETHGQVKTLQNRLHTTHEKQKQTDDKLKRISKTQQEHDERWSKSSSFLADRTFICSELIEWREIWLTWCNHEADIALLNKKIDAHEANENNILDALREAFQNDNASYTALGMRLNETLTEAKSVKGERKAIAAGIESLATQQVNHQDALDIAEANLSKVADEWKICTETLELDDSQEHAAVVTSLELRHAAHTTNREITDSALAHKLILERISSYENKLEKYRDRHLPDSPVIDPAHPDITEKRLAELLSDAKVRKTGHDGIEKDIARLVETLEVKEHAKKSAKVEIQALLTTAQIDTAEQLPELLAQFERRKILQADLNHANSTLTNLAGSLTLDELVHQADSEESDALQVELQSLADDLRSLQDERDTARDTLKGVTSEYEDFSRADDHAANSKQLAANAVAKVVTDSERFIRLQHAIDFLKSQVEEYRKKTQGPMIQRTSEFFTKLTSGSFVGVAAQRDDKDATRINLVAQPHNPDAPNGIGETINTDALSEGTRDQLYLALRLAAIDIHLENHAPMPLILDDICMTFDEERSNAFFEILTNLSEKTQVIVFTHHQHIATMAETFVKSEQILRLA